MLSKIQYILIIILLLLIVLLYYCINKCSDMIIYEKSKHVKFKYIDIDNLYNYINTGDLIFFSSNQYNIKSRILFNNKFSHIGFVININNNKYIIDMLNNDYVFTSKSPYSNINIFDLKYRIEQYAGYCYYAKYNKIFTEQQYAKLLNILKYRNNITYTTSLIKNLSKLIFNNKYKDNMVCIEYVAYLLTNLDIYNCNNIHKKNLMDRIIKLCDGNLYNIPIRLLSKTNLIVSNQILNYCN